jgi:hypothetical protein
MYMIDIARYRRILHSSQTGCFSSGDKTEAGYYDIGSASEGEFGWIS